MGGYIGILAGANGNATVTGNEVSNSELAGIVGISVSGDVNVSDNKVTDGGYVGLGAVAIDGNATVSGNEVSNSGDSGIIVESYSGNATASGNNVNGSKWHGIYVYSEDGDGTATGNKVSNSGRAGIAAASLSGDLNVRDNTVNGGLFGIGVSSDEKVNIKGNTVTENDIGVKIEGTPSQAKVNENNIYSNTTTGLENATSGQVDATNNWWGPGGTGGPGQGGNNDVDNSGGGSTSTTPWSHVRF